MLGGKQGNGNNHKKRSIVASLLLINTIMVPSMILRFASLDYSSRRVEG